MRLHLLGKPMLLQKDDETGQSAEGCHGAGGLREFGFSEKRAYNLCVLLQRRLGQLEKCELNTLRWRLFGRAAAWSRAGGKPTLKLAVQGEANRNWWREMLSKLTAPPNCHAVDSLQA
jgi:hypothetical protein